VGAVILLVGLAKLTLQTCLDLSTNANAISHLDGCHLVSDLDSLADDLVADANWQWAIAPATVDSMDIGATNTTTLNFDINVAVFELFWFELKQRSTVLSELPLGPAFSHLFLLEVGPFALVLDHETLEGVWVTHFGGLRGSDYAIGCNRKNDKVCLRRKGVWNRIPKDVGN